MKTLHALTLVAVVLGFAGTAKAATWADYERNFNAFIAAQNSVNANMSALAAEQNAFNAVLNTRNNSLLRRQQAKNRFFSFLSRTTQAINIAERQAQTARYKLGRYVSRVKRFPGYRTHYFNLDNAIAGLRNQRNAINNVRRAALNRW